MAFQKPCRPFGYNPVKQSRDGHGFCFICRLNSWARGAFWESAEQVLAGTGNRSPPPHEAKPKDSTVERLDSMEAPRPRRMA